ncbi:MAG TPA: MerR family transcriptional regulator [Chloroflexia bacterium]|nr:MerR family transcriptional regulator [Chloroflexia bacterium]
MSTETNHGLEKRVGPKQEETRKDRSHATSEARKRQNATVNAEGHPRYVISIAAQILGVHPQTLRLYEREGLVEPQRSGGKIRLYSERDIERVRSIMRLTNDLGVNLAGADAILYMRERMLRLYEEMDRMREDLLSELEELRRELDVE